MAAREQAVVVIGTGPGGAGVAALLQKRGNPVMLLERNPFCGGKCWSFEKNGFVVDSGVHMFSMSDAGQHGDINRRVGGDLRWLVRNPGECLQFHGQVRMSLYQNFFDPRTMLQGRKVDFYARRHRDRLDKTPSRAMQVLQDSAYRASRKYSLWETLRIMGGVVLQNPTTLLELDEITLQEFMHRITDKREILLGVNALSMLLMVTPFHLASAGEFLWCVTNLFRHRRCGVPQGGSNEIPGAFVRAFQQSGGELRRSTEVTRIVVEEGAVTGVETAAGDFIPAGVVISSAGIKQTVALAGAEHFPPEYVSYVDNLRYSYAFITAKFGLARRVVDLPAPSFFNISNVDPDHMFDYLEHGDVPEDPFLFTPMPSEWDRYAAPLGKQLIIMGVPAPIEVTPENIALCEEILDRAEARLLDIFPQIKDQVEWRLRSHIADTAAITGKPTGECIGLMQCVGQTGIHKPSPRTPIEGLWLVGADAGARGVGTEQASGSALYTAGLIEYQDGRKAIRPGIAAERGS